MLLKQELVKPVSFDSVDRPETDVVRKEIPAAVSVREAIGITFLEWDSLFALIDKFNVILKQELRGIIEQNKSIKIEIVEIGVVPRLIIYLLVGEYNLKGWNVGWKYLECNTHFYFSV